VGQQPASSLASGDGCGEEMGSVEHVGLLVHCVFSSSQQGGGALCNA